MDYKRRDFIEKAILMGTGAAATACSRFETSNAATVASASVATGTATFAVTPTETSIKAVIADPTYPPGTVDRYGVNATPGTTDMTAAFQTAINFAKVTRGTVTYGQTGTYLVTAALNCAESTADLVGTSFQIRNIGPQMASFSAGSQGSIHAQHQDVAVFDCAGTAAISFQNVTVSSNPSECPKTCWFRARNAGGGGQMCSFFNCKVIGSFSVAIDYNYGSEGDEWHGCVLYNYSKSPGTKICYLTATNNLNLQSKFVAITSGSVSCIDHKYIGGEYANVSGDPASDVWYLEGGVASVKIFGGWAACFNPSSTPRVGGRSIIYADTTYGAPDFCTVVGLQIEHSGAEATQQKYGIYFGDTAATVSGWTVIGGTWTNQTNFIAAGPAVIIANSLFSHSNEAYSNGLNIPGTLERCVVEGILAVNIGTSVSNRITTLGTNMNANMIHQNDIIFDLSTGSIIAAGTISANGKVLT